MSGTIGKRQNGNLLKTRVRDKKKKDFTKMSIRFLMGGNRVTNKLALVQSETTQIFLH